MPRSAVELYGRFTVTCCLRHQRECHQKRRLFGARTSGPARYQNRAMCRDGTDSWRVCRCELHVAHNGVRLEVSCVTDGRTWIWRQKLLRTVWDCLPINTASYAIRLARLQQWSDTLKSRVHYKYLPIRQPKWHVRGVIWVAKPVALCSGSATGVPVTRCIRYKHWQETLSKLATSLGKCAS